MAHTEDPAEEVAERPQSERREHEEDHAAGRQTLPRAPGHRLAQTSGRRHSESTPTRSSAAAPAQPAEPCKKHQELRNGNNDTNMGKARGLRRATIK